MMCYFDLCDRAVWSRLASSQPTGRLYIASYKSISTCTGCVSVSTRGSDSVYSVHEAVLRSLTHYTLATLIENESTATDLTLQQLQSAIKQSNE